MRGRAHYRGVDRCRPERPGQLTDAVADQAVPLHRDLAELVLVRRDVATNRLDAHPDAVELGELLTRVHPRHEIADSLDG